MPLESFSATASASQLNSIAQQVVITCTSGTRPGTPSEGMTIYETDTDRLLVYSGSAWVRLGVHSSSSGRTGGSWTRSTTQSIPNTTVTNISWNSESSDTDNILTPTSATATVPVAGVYAITANVNWASAATNGFLRITAGGTAYDFDASMAGSAGTGTLVVSLSASATVVVAVYQATGGALNVSTAGLQIWRLQA